MRRFTLFLIISVFCLFALGDIGELSVFAAASEQRVYDEASLFSKSQTNSMEGIIEELRGTIKMDVVVLTIDDAQGKTSEAYADDYYDYNGFGTGKDASGVILLIDMDNREIYISTTGKMIKYLTDQRINTLLDSIYTQVAKGDYYRSAIIFLSEVEKYINEGIPKSQYEYDTETGKIKVYRSLEAVEIVLALAVALAVGGIGIAVVKRRYRQKVTVYKYPFKKNGKLELTNQADVFITQNITSHQIDTDHHSSGGSFGGGGSSSGRSSTHTSSSGSSHGGGGRSF